MLFSRLRFPFCCALLALSAAGVSAQDCKPHRANRHKTLMLGRFEGVSKTVTEWTTRDGHYHLKLCEATLFVSKDGGAAYPLPVRDRVIMSPYIVYEQDGEVWTDTLTPTGAFGATHHYFDDRFHSYHVRATTSEARRSLRYFRTNGKDSLLIIRHTAGTPQNLTRFGADGRDSLTQQWSAEGILLFRKTAAAGEERTYTPDGILHTHRYDTVGRRGFCFKTYYPSGILESVKYFVDQAPIAVWRFYDADGRLIRTEKKGAVPLPAVVDEAPPPPQEIYTMVQEMPSFPGDIKMVLGGPLAEVLCRARVPLKAAM